MLARWREEEGAVLVLTAILLVALVAASAVAVDLGRTAAASRDQQGATDRAALDAVLAVASADPLAVRAAALESLERNLGLSDGMSSSRDYDVAPVACGPDGRPTTASWSSADGIEVTTTSTVRSLFLGSTSEVERRAVACVRSVGAVSAASTTASVSGGLLDDLLSALVGGDVSLDLVGYGGVADARIDLTVLAAEAGVGTVAELLDAQLGVAELLEVTAAALERDAPSAVALGLAGQLRSLAAVAVGLPAITLGEVLHLDTGAEAAGATLGVDALELVLASLQLANRGHAVELETAVGSDLVGVRLTIIEPPVIAVGRPGRHGDGRWRTEARTAQVALEVDLPIGQLASTATGTLDADQAARIADYRARIDAATSLTQVRAIGDELKEELAQVKQHLEDRGYTSLANAVGALITGLVTLLADIVGGLLCLLTPLACAKADLRKKVDEYAAILEHIDATAAGDAVHPSTQPTLTVTTGEGWARLASIGCGDPLETTVELEARAAHVRLPRTDLLDLGPLGRITVELDTSLGTAASPTLVPFDPPLPSAPHRHGGAQVGLGSLLPSIDASGSRLLLLPIGEVVGLLSSALSPVLEAVDSAVLTPVLELLGADLGVVEGRVLDASCTSRSLVE